jgi:3-methyladenine DNA glycosylase/8-oxoguanine DNA glycosylase
MTAEEFAKARRLLMRRDPVLAPVIKQHRQRSLLDAPVVDPFSALVRTITAQQISTKAAATIHGRLVALMPGGVATPEALLSISDEQLRTAGLSRQKSAYLRDLGEKVSSGVLPIQALANLTDDEVIDAIVKVKGLGRWAGSSAPSTISGDIIQMQFHGQTSSQARQRMQLSGSSIRCFGDFTPCDSHSGSTCSTT